MTPESDPVAEEREAGRFVHPMDGAGRRRALQAAAVAGGALAAGAVARLVSDAPDRGPQGRLTVVDAAGGGDFTDLEEAVLETGENTTIFVRRGTYVVRRGSMSPAAGVVLQGEGNGSHIQLADGADDTLFLVDAPDVSFRALRLDGNGRRQAFASGNCIQFHDGGQGGSVIGCRVERAAGYNIVCAPGSSHVTIVGNHSLDAVEEGIELQGASHCVVTGNVVRGCEINGILLWNSTGDCRGNQVYGNTVSDCRSFGILVLDGAHENAITGNTVARCGGFGIAIDNSTPSTRGAYDLTDDVSDAYGNAVTGNVVVDNRADGIRLNGVSLAAVGHNVVRRNGGNGIYANSVSACSIRGNVVSGNARSGILVDMADGVCNGNVCTSNGSDAGGSADAAAISIHADTRATSFAGNRCAGSAHGFAVRSVADATLDGNVVDGNRRSGVVRRGRGRVRSPLRRSLGATVGSRRTAVPHGLPFVPTGVAVTPRARGEVWQAAPPDGRFVYLESDRDAVPVEVIVG